MSRLGFIFISIYSESVKVVTSICDGVCLIHNIKTYMSFTGMH